MAEVEFVQFSWNVRYRVRLFAHTLLRPIADEHFQVRTAADDPDPDPVDPAAPSDPVRVAQGVMLPPETVDRLRQVATESQVHIYVHPATHE